MTKDTKDTKDTKSKSSEKKHIDLNKPEPAIINPYTDELDKKRKTMNPAEIRIKNFDIKPKKVSEHTAKGLKKSYSDENMFETFTKDLMKSVKD